MAKQIFARAKPSIIRIKETYKYHANISGNPTLEEMGEPEGEILVELPFDGYEHFTRQAYADILHQYQQGSNELFATIGHLAVSGISSDAFWHDVKEYPARQILGLVAPLPEKEQGLGCLIEDRHRATSKHTYQPKWPEVYPRPRPLSLNVDLYDERTLQDTLGDQLDVQEWLSITQEHYFERSLFFDFRIELALPSHIKFSTPPTIKVMRLEWPVATSYHMLNLNVESRGGDEEEWPVIYVPDKGSVEWRDLEFRSGLLSPIPKDEKASSGVGPQFFHAPIMLLNVREPGELYRKPKLICRLEIELKDVLLSDLEAKFFNATGELDNSVSFETKTLIVTDIEINLEQRFNRKILSPHQHLQFEGVMPEDIRIEDISNLLKDLGFRVDPKIKLKEEGNRRIYALPGRKTEGPDEMLIWIVASGSFAPTERETVIPGGKTFKTTVVSGNMELDLHAELRGNVKKLTQIMNTIHTSLKERFRHVSTIE
jgi:hypothetical protein